MIKTQWLQIVHDNWDDLSSIILRYHPSCRLRESDLKITAGRAEEACQNIRKEIQKESNLPFMNTEAYLTSIKNNIDTLYTVLSETWFGVPESTSCWNIPGFSLLCTLLEEPPE